MGNFWDFSSWGFFNLTAVLLGSLLVGNMLKRSIPVLRDSLIPTSVLGGGLLLVIVGIWRVITGEDLFESGHPISGRVETGKQLHHPYVESVWLNSQPCR